MKEEPAPDAKCKDKFLVQTVAVTGDMEFSNVSSIVRCPLLQVTCYTFSNSYLVRESFKILHPGAQDPCELAACRVLKC
jgi:O-acetylhomoserine/O-acetylserine sulfhydrylase-like pyridoxal-dependent enzyme